MGILGLHTNEYEMYYSNLYNKLPALKAKFRDQLTFSGQKYDYKEISKVWITESEGKYIITPKIFNLPDQDLSKIKEVDYIGLYAIGLMELLYLVLSSSLHNDGGEQIKDLSELFDILCKNSFKDFKEIEHIYEKFFDPDKSKEYDKAFNLFFAMRTDYSKMGYNLVMRHATLLMVIWSVDPKQFWELFFEIMNFISPIYLMLLEDVILKEGESSILINYWLDGDRDLHFERISYVYPGTGKTRYITDCRGVSIFSCLSLYYGFLFNHGFNPSKNPVLIHNNKDVVAYLIAHIAVCFGDDYQSKFLLGDGLDGQCVFDLREAYHSSIQTKNYYSATNGKMPKSIYEDLVLFSIAHQPIEDIAKSTIQSIDVNMHYASIHDVFHTIGYILYTNYQNILSVNLDDYVDTIKKLETQNNRLNSELEKSKQKIDEIINNSTNNTEVEQLKDKIDNLQRILDSKTDIIEQLSTENKELNSFISNIYSDDDMELEEEQIEVSISEMVNYLNDFKFLMVGGRFELLQKLAEYGWTNLDQFDGRKNLGAAQLPISDFYVLNTKFISHKVTWKVESGVADSETVMYYNGTNPEKLIESCYKFVTEFFEK